MSRILRTMDGAEVCHGCWRVPLVKMPPRCWIEIGLLEPEDHVTAR